MKVDDRIRKNKAQIRKEKYNRLRSIGFTVEESKKYREYSDTKFDKIINERIKDNQKKHRNEVRKQRRNAKKEKLIQAGYTPAEANKYIDCSNEKITELIIAKGTATLLIGYKDITEETDNEALYLIKKQNRKRSRQRLIASIMGWLSGENQGFIGGYKMLVSNNPENDKSFMHDMNYSIAYEGKGIYLQPLLSIIDNMMVLLYTIEQKDEFIQDLINNLYLLPYPQAHKNADYIRDNIYNDIVSEREVDHF